MTTTAAPVTNRVRIRLRRPVSPREPVQAVAPTPHPVAPPAPAFPFVPDPDELGSPSTWLYVSKRLDLQWLPNEPLWAVPVLTIESAIGVTVFYRLSARVLNWLTQAGHQLERQWESGELARDQLDAYLEAMGSVWTFAGEHLSEAARDRARLLPASLPEVDAGAR